MRVEYGGISGRVEQVYAARRNGIHGSRVVGEDFQRAFGGIKGGAAARAGKECFFRMLKDGIARKDINVPVNVAGDGSRGKTCRGRGKTVPAVAVRFDNPVGGGAAPYQVIFPVRIRAAGKRTVAEGICGKGIQPRPFVGVNIYIARVGYDKVIFPAAYEFRFGGGNFDRAARLQIGDQNAAVRLLSRKPNRAGN